MARDGLRRMLTLNIFRLLGDASHLLSFFVMFWKLFTSQSVAGISLKTQEIYGAAEHSPVLPVLPPCAASRQHVRLLALTLCSSLAVIVFCFRYLDLFWNYLSLYNSVMKAPHSP